MTKLLKDMPECMERVENSQSLISEIKDIIEQETSLCLNEDIDTNNGEYPSNNGDNFTDYVDIDNSRYGSEIVLKLIIDFVNQNYEWKGVKK